MTEESEGITVEQAQALIDQDKRDRAKQCGMQITQLLKQYSCEFDVVTIIQGNRVIQRMDLVAR